MGHLEFLVFTQCIFFLKIDHECKDVFGRKIIPWESINWTDWALNFLSHLFIEWNKSLKYKMVLFTLWQL